MTFTIRPSQTLRNKQNDTYIQAKHKYINTKSELK